MNIFDPLISGSLSVSGSGHVSGNLTVLGTISGTTTNAISASHAAEYTLTSSFHQFTSSYTTSSFTGSFKGDGSGLINIPASGVTGLNLNKIISGSVSASISPDNGFEINTDITVSGHITPSVDNLYDLGSPTHQWRDVYISSGSLYIDGSKVLSSTTQELTITTNNGQSLKILEGTTDSIVLQTADGNIELKSNADGDILLDPTNGKILLKGPVEVLSGQKIQSSVGGTPVVFASDIVVSGSIELMGTIEGIDLTAFSSSVNGKLFDLENDVTSLNSFTSSANLRLNGLETESGSVRTTLNNYTSSTNDRLVSIETVTGSILSTNISQTNRLDSIEGKTGSYATTGSNRFNGNQTITGSLTITDNLTVLGSSSIIYSTASQLIVEDNVIIVNASYPAERFAGLEIHDSGSNGSVTASLFWDGLHNRFIYSNTSDSHYGGGMFIAGPRNTGSLGDEPGLTNGRIPKSIGGDHIGDSIINELSGNISISGSLVITGSVLSTNTPLVSGSSQISFNGITDKPTLVSGSSQISFNTISDKPTLVSGSSQITYSSISSIPSGIVSGSSQISYPSLSNIPGGIVSGSSQIDLTSTTNYSSGIKTRLNAEGVISGSSQVTSIGNSQLTNSSFHVGTTSISLGRTSASQTLTGVSIDGNATSETLSTITGRGASTSTAISINNTLTVTSGRIIARTGGINTYGVFSGYDNNNHMMAFRSDISGPTATPTFTARHQTTFVEFAEANDTTGWFFKSSSSTNYEEILKITRTGITPGTNGTQNLGSSSFRWNTVFTSDLSLSNGIGDYTIVEGENDLFLYNNKQNKVYKFMLQEVNPNDATPKRPE